MVAGGSGYLGQFLITGLAAQGWRVGFTHNSTAQPSFQGDVRGFWVDLATGEGLEECFQALGPLEAVLNCAAISQPVACERDPERTRRVGSLALRARPLPRPCPLLAFLAARRARARGPAAEPPPPSASPAPPPAVPSTSPASCWPRLSTTASSTAARSPCWSTSPRTKSMTAARRCGGRATPAPPSTPTDAASWPRSRPSRCE